LNHFPLYAIFKGMNKIKIENKATIRFMDLFAGIGGFRYSIQNAGKAHGIPVECVFTSEIDQECQNVYKENFGETPQGDITQIPAETIPDHDILLAGFPCQPFSIIPVPRDLGYDNGI